MVSVIIPMYNTENYVFNCLWSLENQIYRNFEIIIVDDGSKDQSRKIVEDYIEKTQMHIILICQENRGVSVARNNGIKNAHGNFICFIDSDDMVHPSYLDDLISAIEADKVDMVICNMMFIHENIDNTLKFNIVDDEKSTIKIGTHEGLKKFLYREITPGVGSFLLRKELIIENSLKFEEKYRYSEDVEFIFKALSNSKCISLIDARLYCYRIRDTSAMSFVDEKRVDGYVLMKRLEEYFDKGNPDFANEFRKFGVSRWVWATLWQIASTSRDYKDFLLNSSKYNPRENMRSLLKFPKAKVYFSALVYIASPFVYYNLVKNIFRKSKRYLTS